MAACGNARLGLVRGGAAAARAQPSLADLFFLCFAPPAIVGLLVLAKRPVTRAGWVCLGAGRLADRRLAAHPLLEPRARPRRAQVDGRERRARRALAGLSAAGHRAGQHGARAALPALRGQPLRGQHRDRRPRADRAVRRPVHLAAAARRATTPASCSTPAGSPARCCSPTPPGAHAAHRAREPPQPPARPAARTTSRPHRRLAAPRSPRIWPPPSAPWASSTTSSTAAGSTGWCSSPAARSCSPWSSGRASCSSTTSPSPRNWPRRRTTSAPWCRAPATSS